ncbi:MAG: hypothetical protein GC171_02220 [Terrimonas sp.]|nr:hypothetical protein [Terrimonas sp.]
MEISFFKPKDFEGNMKATIHITGKLGFTDAAIKKIGLNEKKGIKIGHNTKDKNDKNLYVVFTEELDEDTFKINKAGAYYYVNTKALFDSMELPYRAKRVSFDIIPTEIGGIKVYKFMYKEKLKADDKETDDDDDLS